MTQTLPLSLILGFTNSAKLIGYTVLHLDRTEYAAFALATESAVAGTYYAAGGYAAADAGGYLVVSESDGGDPAILTALAETDIDPAVGLVTANVIQLAGATVPLDNLVLSLGGARLATIADLATATLTVISAVDGLGVITIYQAVSFQATISGLAIPAGWTKLWWTVKQDAAQADADAVIQMVESNPGAGTDGLLRLNGAAGTAANGSLTVSPAAGTVVIDLVDEHTDDLAPATGLIWSLKALTTGGATTLLAVGTLNVRGQATAAIA